jgi:dihydroorotate dehydrogenase/NAD-dependent dihydropyrimidine dehydrogenase PreA subunit
MNDLHVNLAGLQLKNPIVVAAGDIGCHLGQIKEAAHYGAGAFITKGCIPKPGAVGLSRKARFRFDLKRGAFSGMAGARRQGLDQAIKLIVDAKKQVKIPVGANIFVMFPSDEERELVTQAARHFYEKGVDFIELDTTGNLPVHFGETQAVGNTDECFLDDMAASYPSFVHDCIQSVKSVVDVPVISKVAYENLNVPALLRAMEKARVDIIDVGNAGMGVMPGIIDIYNPGKMKGGFISADKNLGLCMTGAPLRATAQAYLIRSAKYVQTPIIGCGGIMNWQHIVEDIMCGAVATSICTAFMIRGFEIIKDMETGLKKFMQTQGYNSFADIRGLLLDKIALTPSEIKVRDAVARVNPEKCTGCGLCTKPAHCGLYQRAIRLQKDIAVVNADQCIGCETCASICPVDAIEILLEQE